MTTDREYLKNLEPFKKVQFLAKRKLILQAKLSNMQSDRRKDERMEILTEIATIDSLIKKYV